MLLEFLDWRLGAGAVEAVLADVGEERPVAVMCDDATWHTYDEFRALLESAARHLGGAAALRNIGEMPLGAGSKPEITALFTAFGSPTKMALSMGDAGMFPIFDFEVEVRDRSYLAYRHRFVEGYEPFPELCQFFCGLMPLSVRIFGLRILEVGEESCCNHGDDWCTITVRWDEAEDLGLQLEHARFMRRMAEGRLAAFQDTVAEIVSADDLDTVLRRIVDAAVRSTTAKGFVLELDTPATGVHRYVEGLDDHDAGAAVRRSAAGEPGYLRVEVVSQQRRYGCLIVLDVHGNLEFERPALESYARLAATALDSAFALDEARRQAATSAALLELSTAIGELTGAGELAARVVQTMTSVIDADCAAVLLVGDDTVRVAAHHGFESTSVPALEELELDFDAGHVGIVVHTAADAAAAGDAVAPLFALAALEAVAAAPIAVDDAPIGYLLVGVHDRAERIVGAPHLAERFGGLAGQAAVALRNGRLLDQIRHQSLHDPLTDLPNRALILDRAEQLLARARRHRQCAAALFIDLDGFKNINDTLGHGAGDALLQILAGRLRAAVRGSDTVGRLGGDEFVVLIEDAAGEAGIEAAAERLLELLSEPFVLPGRDRPMMITASIGIAVGDRVSAVDLLRDADIALYNAKAAGKSCYRVFAPEMQRELRLRTELAEGLGLALDRNEFFLVYQPILDLRAGTIIGVEALLRWDHPERGVIPPDQFIPLLEESGQIVDVGRWVLDVACAQTACWHAQGHAIAISVNASVRQLERLDFVADVDAALAASGLDPASLIVEVTETAIMRDTEVTISVLEHLKARGVRIAIDDFGTGYSSLAYLRQFPVDALKIDGSFIAAAADSSAARELIHTLIRLGKALQLETLAEGIEQPDQLACLRAEGCDSGQGYMFARPLPHSEMTAYLERAREDAA